MELLRKDLKALGEQRYAGCMDGNLTGLCPEHLSGNSDHIADVKLFKLFVILLADTVTRHIGLDISFQILHIAEGSLSHDTLGHHAACDGHLFPFQLLVVILDLLAVVCLVILRDHKRVFPVLLKFRELLAAHLP